MATKTDYIRARINPELKASTQAIFENLGLSTTDAIILFLKQVEMKNGIPFELTVNEPVKSETPKLPRIGKSKVDIQARLDRIYKGREVKGDAVGELLKERYD